MLWLVMLALPIGVMGQGSYPTPYTFRTVAGLVASPGYADGTGSAARFSDPWGVAVDGAGNVYVAERGNQTIRKITPAGVVTTLAGLAGYRSSHAQPNGPIDTTLFNDPSGVVVDGSGSVYVSNWSGNSISKITAAGVVTSLAGGGGMGYTDGTGGGARFSIPAGVASDGLGNIYVAELGNCTIRKVTAAGVVTTVAGLAGSAGSEDGTGSAARFCDPSGVAMDGAGNVYVADSINDTIRKITPTGVVTTLAGQAGASGYADGTVSAAQFNNPMGVAVDGWGNVYVADTGNNMIRKITAAGVVTTLAGQTGSAGSADGVGTAALFNAPTGVAVDGLGSIYVADKGNNTIRKITINGVVTTLAGLAAAATVGNTDGVGIAARFESPWGMAVDGAGNIYVSDTANSTIRKVTATGVVTTLAGLAGVQGSADGTGSAARFLFPYGVAVDQSGTVYVADLDNNTIRKVTASGVVTTLAGLAGVQGSADGTGSVARFFYPAGIAVDQSGNIYVADKYNGTIRKITSAGAVTTLAGLAGAQGSADGTGSAARFLYPAGVAVDQSGNVYVADTSNSTIRRITPGGVVTTLAGQVGSAAYGDGTSTAARFKYPSGLAVDLSGNVYVADTVNYVIRKVTAVGVVTTLAGLGQVWGSVDGIGSSARFAVPEGVAVDGAGNVYVADTGNNTIRAGLFLLPLSIQSQPQSQTVTAGGSVHFSVLAAGQPTPTCQWYFNGVAITGATSTTLDLSNVQPSNAGSYVVVLTNNYDTVTSSSAVLTVNTGTVTGSSGGGGAVEAWFVLALALLAAVRMRAQAKKEE
jgi:sugar lactone lactonase YvrE